MKFSWVWIISTYSFVCGSANEFKDTNTTCSCCDIVSRLNEIRNLRIAWNKITPILSDHNSVYEPFNELELNSGFELNDSLQANFLQYQKLLSRNLQKWIKNTEIKLANRFDDIKKQIAKLSLKKEEQDRSTEEICPVGWIHNPGSDYCFYFGTKHEKMKFYSANQFCKTLGGSLVSVHSKQENNFIKSNLIASSWLGLSDIPQEGTFSWTEGESITFSEFQLGQPDNYKNGEHCVQIKKYKHGDIKWNDVSCLKSYPPICKRMLTSIQISKDSDMDSILTSVA